MATLGNKQRQKPDVKRLTEQAHGKVSARYMKDVLRGHKCGYCGNRNSKVICIACKAAGQLFGWCDNCKHTHDSQKAHHADFIPRPKRLVL